MRFIVTILNLALFAACHPAKHLEQTREVKRDSTQSEAHSQSEEKVRDSVVYALPDESLLEMLVRCDSLNQAHVSEIISLKNGRRLVAPSVRIDSNRITINCKVDSLAVYYRISERFSRVDTSYKHVAETTKTSLKAVVPDCTPTGWQWFQIWLGRILLILVLGRIIYKFLKSKLSLRWAE